MSLSNFVNVSVVVSGKGPSRRNFGMPLIAHYHTHWPQRVREYGSVQEMLDDGFAAGDAAVRAATALMSQQASPASFKVGRMATTPVAHVEKLTPTVLVGATYSIELSDTDGVITTYSYEAEAGDGVDDICDAFLAAINADADIAVTASVLGSPSTDLVLTGDNAGEVFYCHAYDDSQPIGSLWARECTNSDPGIATDLAAINGADPAFYGLIVTNPARSCQSAAATWALANGKLLGITTGDTDARDGTTPNIIDDIGAAENAQAFAVYSRRPQRFHAAGLMGRQFALNPGSSSWAIKAIQGVEVDDLSSTHKNNIANGGGNWYASISDLGTTYPGRTGAGLPISITHGRDWLVDTLQTEIFAFQRANEKVGYTRKYFAGIEATIRGVLDLAASDAYGFVTDDYTITTPQVSEVLASDKSQGYLPGFKFKVTLQGEAIKIDVQGSLTFA